MPCYYGTREDVDLYCPNPACQHQWSAVEVYEADVNCRYLAVDEDGECPECGTAGVYDEPCFEDVD